MERSAEAGFKVADHGLDPAEIGQIFGMVALNDQRLMIAAHLCNSTKASQPIGDYLTSSCQSVLGPVCNRCEGEGFNLGHLHVTGMTGHLEGNDGDDRNIVL